MIDQQLLGIASGNGTSVQGRLREARIIFAPDEELAAFVDGKRGAFLSQDLYRFGGCTVQVGPSYIPERVVHPVQLAAGDIQAQRPRFGCLDYDFKVGTIGVRALNDAALSVGPVELAGAQDNFFAVEEIACDQGFEVGAVRIGLVDPAGEFIGPVQLEGLGIRYCGKMAGQNN